MIASHIATRFRRFGVSVEECIWIDGEPFFSAEAIGKFLEFKYPRESINKIIQRNPYILEYSREVAISEVEIQSGNKKALEVNLTPPLNPHHKSKTAKKEASKSHFTATFKRRYFDLMGLFLVSQESHTEVAKKMKVGLARLGKMRMIGKLVERTQEDLEAEKILEDYNHVGPRHEVRPNIIKAYMEETGCSRATAYRHAKVVENNESPSDKKWKNAIPPIIDEELGLQIRRIFFTKPDLTIREIWRMIGEKPSYTTVKVFVNKLKKERDAAKAFGGRKNA